MKPNAQKNRKLLAQFPFLNTILSTGMEPYGGQDGKQVDELVIRVQRADGDLMFRQADNVGLGDGSFIFNVKGNRKGQIMRQAEYLYAIGKDGVILNELRWPRNAPGRREAENELYGYHVLWTEYQGNSCYSGYIGETVNCLVWVTVQAWHEDTKSELVEKRFGQFIDRSVEMTIFGKPDGGFSKLQETSCKAENLRLTSDVLIRGALAKDADILNIGGRLDELCRSFQDMVYFNGMKEMFDKGEYRGASGVLDGIEVLCAELCGYDRIMLQSGNTWVSFQLRPGASMLYTLGMGGTLPQIRDLVRRSVKAWSSPEAQETFKPNPNVSVM